MSIRSRWALETVKRHVLKQIHNDDLETALQYLDCVETDWILVDMPTEIAQGLDAVFLSQRPPAIMRPLSSSTECTGNSLRICIVGAGVSGLYLGMLLDELRIPNLSYEVLECNQRSGGRIYTHRFGPAEGDYYDVGAMRFPKIPPLQRAFDLFKRCNIDLALYEYMGHKCPKRFNGVSLSSGSDPSPSEDPFRLSTLNGGVVPHSTVVEGPENILRRAFAPFIDMMVSDFQTGFTELMKYDHTTTREYLMGTMGLDFYSTWYIETLSSASGLYDQSFTEAVIDAMDFEYPDEDDRGIEWYRVPGGTSRLVEKMEQELSSKPTLGARVVSIAYDRSGDPDFPMCVGVDGEAEVRRYSAVFSTSSLPCMRRMALGPDILTPGQRAAIQSIHYDASTKVAIKFKTAWWTRYCQITGGQASTDLPIRTCVYPSSPGARTATGSSDDAGHCTVLLCSYTWGQDAQQMASLINGGHDKPRAGDTGGPEAFFCHNLAALHQDCLDPATGESYGYARMLSIIQEEYEEYHAYDWYADASTAGAFAYFGPSQFQHFYPELVKPAAGGHMFLVGEACSAHHAWVSGALDSAYRALLQYLYKLTAEGRVTPSILRNFQEAWGALDEIPEEVMEWQVFLARLSLG